LRLWREKILSLDLFGSLCILQPLFKNEKAFINGVSEELFNRGICLPSPTALSFDELIRVVEVIGANVK